MTAGGATSLSRTRRSAAPAVLLALRPSDPCQTDGLNEAHNRLCDGSTLRCLLRALEPSAQFRASVLPTPCDCVATRRAFAVVCARHRPSQVLDRARPGGRTPVSGGRSTRRGPSSFSECSAVVATVPCGAHAVEQAGLLGCEDASDLAAASLQVKRRSDLNKSNLGISILPGSLLHHS